MVKVTYLSLFVAALLAKEVAALSSSSNLFDDWSQHDLIQYMKDNGQKTFSSKDGLEELRKQVAESFTKSKEQAPWWKFWESDSSSTDGFGVHSKNEVVDWLFNTWPADSLKKLLKDARISVAGEASKDELINTLKQNFKKVSQHLGVSGYYPSEAFFKGWSVDDMKSWLDQYGISYDKAKASKDELLSAVRKNMHRASRYADDERFEMLSSLDLVNEKFTETGNFDHVDFSKWSVDDLKKWLHLHGVQLGNKVANNRDELVEVATSKKDLLKDDLNWLVEVADRKWDSILKDSTGLGSTWDKTKEKIGGLTDMFKGSPEDEGIINDTFLVDVENWPKDRLREFLDARGVTYSMLSTRNDLLDLVKKYKNKPLQSWMDVTSKWFHGLSSKDSAGDDESTLEKGGKKAKDKLKSIGSDIRTGTAKVSDSVNKKFDDWSSVFDSWSTEELTEYLKSFGIHAPKASKKKLVNLAKSNSKSFFGSFNEESGLYSYLPRKVREWARYGTSYLLNR